MGLILKTRALQKHLPKPLHPFYNVGNVGNHFHYPYIICNPLPYDVGNFGNPLPKRS